MRLREELRVFPNALSLSVWTAEASQSCVWGVQGVTEREFFTTLANWGAGRPCLGGPQRRLLILRLLSEKGRPASDFSRVDKLVEELRGAAITAMQFRDAVKSGLGGAVAARLDFFFDLYKRYVSECERVPDLDRGLRLAVRRLAEGQGADLGYARARRVVFSPLQRLSWQKTRALDALARQMAPRELVVEVPHWAGGESEHPAQVASDLLLGRLEALAERASLSASPVLLPMRPKVDALVASGPAEERAQVVSQIKAALECGAKPSRIVVLVPDSSMVPLWEQSLLRAGIDVLSPQKRLAHTAWGSWFLQVMDVLSQAAPARDAVVTLLESAYALSGFEKPRESAAALRKLHLRGHAPVPWAELARAVSAESAVRELEALSEEFREPRSLSAWHLWLRALVERFSSIGMNLEHRDWLTMLTGETPLAARGLREHALAAEGASNIVDALSVAGSAEIDSDLQYPTDFVLSWVRSEFSASVLPREIQRQGVRIVTRSELPILPVDLLVAAGLVETDFPGAVVDESLLSRSERAEVARALGPFRAEARWVFDLASLQHAPAGHTVEMARQIGTLLVASEFAEQCLWSRSDADWEGRSLEPSRVWSAIESRDVFDPSVSLHSGAMPPAALARAEREAARLAKMLNPEQSVAQTSDEKVTRANRGLRFSASSLEDVAACRFRYFCKHVLRVNDDEDASEDLDNRLLGQLAHQAFEKLVSRLIEDGCVPFEPSRAERAITIAESALDVIVTDLDFGVASTRVYQPAELALLKRRLLSLVTTLYDRGEGYTPERLEQGFGFDEPDGWPALTVETEYGSAQVRGRIDMVERREQSVRVSDLKSSGLGRLESKIGNKLGLRELQLSVYCAAAAAAYRTRDVDGRLLSLRDGASTRTLRRRHKRRGRYTVDVDQRVLRDDEHGADSEFEAQLKSLVRDVQRVDFKVYPAEGACDFCAYAAACRFPRGAPMREDGA